ncbi:histidinol-phosphatase HisJ family protein [Cetobacterium sp. 2A]|uniref:histidinol-phosphatase HisJ family protein n=1 Tax=unclassified Cetobacterium TaxID=2630983 RepID=UPI00163D34BC|nr:histidinol-phosphatase HisJ family protein [Cetobacterium sp. 2A]MBC2854972.1 histidinol-phosphatase HisJ family protein [Cetobacterium sp. 2A]
MKLLSDYHIHSKFSGDSNEELEKIINQAQKLGMKEIAITDHYDFDVINVSENFMVNFEEYVPKILELKDIYKDKIDIKLGVEFGMQPHLKDYARNLLKMYPFDFIIASSHSIDRIDVSSKDFFIEKTPEKAHEDYFKNLLKNLDSFDEFSVWGHLDFITRYGGPQYRELNYKKNWDIIEEILKKIISLGRGIEINTSGFRYGENRFYPKDEVLKRYFELGGEVITIGSDAHKFEDIGKDFNVAYDFLESIGVKYISSFKNKEVSFKKYK